jgi:trans-2,3-dihydro-3-hydroxyanthranilate isomerase
MYTSVMHAYLIADVFTDTPLEGNPLAVFPEASGLSDEHMQRTARELNLSETVFVFPPEQGGDARVRIFTPGTELPFAGHPVLGTAFVVAERDGLDVVRLETRAGVVPVELERDGDEIRFGRMEQPIPTIEPYERADELLRALGVDHSGLPVEAYTNGPRHVYVELPTEAAVAGLRPDVTALGDHEGIGAVPFAGAGRRWKARNFAPALGVTEDPATGSAAGPMAVHLARHGRIAFGEGIEIRQGEEIGRPSLLHAQVDGSAENVERVTVGGSAVIVAHGSYRLA